MDATFRRTMTSVTDLLFPVSKSAVCDNRHYATRHGANEYMTNLPLQMLIYFNCFFSPFWFLTAIVMLDAKFQYLSQLYQIVLVSVYTVFTIVEIVRLYLGFVGNLMERVSELSGFWLLTLILQLPLILLLLLNHKAVLLPLERAVHVVETVFIVAQIAIGYTTIRSMVRHQVMKYHLQQFTDLRTADHGQY